MAGDPRSCSSVAFLMCWRCIAARRFDNRVCCIMGIAVMLEDHECPLSFCYF
jgi:putative aminopeptidase FrvX